jgi:hypothetical protein
MAIVPNDTRFIGINPSVNLTERRSARINRETQPVSMQDITDSVRPYKVYTALVSQSGENDPEVIVLENTIGEIEWNYRNVGNYSAELVDAFTDNKTAFFISGLDGDSGDGGGSPLGSGTSIVFMSKNRVDLFVVDPSGNSMDGSLVKYPIEIRVYN